MGCDDLPVVYYELFAFVEHRRDWTVSIQHFLCVGVPFQSQIHSLLSAQPDFSCTSCLSGETFTL
jgi:hypothetical protein